MNAKIITIAVVLLLIVLGVLYFIPSNNVTEDIQVPAPPILPEDVVTATTTGDGSETSEEVSLEFERETVLGTSLMGNDILAYHYGTGTKEVLFVGGIHGGYSWNTVLLARELMSYLSSTPSAVPEGTKVTVVPLLNPDGLLKTTGTVGEFSFEDIPDPIEKTIPGRFNANEVDLNRNFDCDWEAEGTWQSRTVSGGTSAFSEPESIAIRDYVNSNTPSAVVVWYSSAGGVYSSNCHDGILPETELLTSIYADASGYEAYEEFDFYKITGDMVNWLASEEIPAISVLLTNHTDVEWDKNKKGIDAVIEYVAE